VPDWHYADDEDEDDEDHHHGRTNLAQDFRQDPSIIQDSQRKVIFGFSNSLSTTCQMFQRRKNRASKETNDGSIPQTLKKKKIKIGGKGRNWI